MTDHFRHLCHTFVFYVACLHSMRTFVFVFLDIKNLMYVYIVIVSKCSVLTFTFRIKWQMNMQCSISEIFVLNWYWQMCKYGSSLSSLAFDDSILAFDDSFFFYTTSTFIQFRTWIEPHENNHFEIKLQKWRCYVAHLTNTFIHSFMHSFIYSFQMPIFRMDCFNIPLFSFH